MKRISWITALALITGTALAAETAEVAVPKGWKLVWAEEFDQDGPPDPERWQHEKGFERNHELQWYQAGNSVCKDGLLVIEARRERLPNPWFKPGSSSWKTQRKFAEYTSGSIISRPEIPFQYGRYEIRARIPVAPGMWPAIWTTGRDGHWPACGEIDIMEYYRGMILANFVQADERGRDDWNASQHPIGTFGGPEWSKEFHVWAMEWSEDRIDLFLNGKLLNSHDLTKSFNGNQPGVNPFRAPHRFRLNLAVGGQGGDPAKAEFPQRYEVDYVRYFQKAGE
ncbi:MAG: glycoside hydrolase family 16 protein [Akkermansiaceae bacterium]|nr:glycoside hydrolase family 16 protein [Akkermansiaceae bacterium]